MKEYHKIQTVFLRDQQTKKICIGQYTLPEFHYLRGAKWVWTEKVDGTNIRILWDGTTVRFGGKTDNAQIPTQLLSVLQDMFPAELLAETFGTTSVCLYGEGYGNKIQSVGREYLPDSNSFILFDVRIGEWLERDNVFDIAHKLGIRVVPIIDIGTLDDAIAYAQLGYKSILNFDLPNPPVAEGLVLKPNIELFNRKGERIIAKIKYRDFL